MRILQANKFHFVKGGAERYYLDLSRRLEERGHTVYPFAMHQERNESSAYERYFVGEVDYHATNGLLGKLRQGLRTIYNRETVRQVESLVAQEKPQIAHFHNIYHQLSLSLVTALGRLGVPMVQTLHDYKIVCPGYLLMTGGEICERCKGGKYYSAVRHRCLMNAYGPSLIGYLEASFHAWMNTYAKISYWLCPSRFLLEKVAEFGVPREKLIHFPYFLPLEGYRPAYAASDYFIYLGRLSREKGVATLLGALQRRGGRKLTCRILGEGPLEEPLKRQAAEWGLKGVEFSGYLQGEALQATIRNAAFTVVPSEWYENLPFAVLESFALGTPVVGARQGGIPEMVLHEETGLCFTSGSTHELAAALDWMEAHSERRCAMGRAARALVEERYAPEEHLTRLEALYAKLASLACASR